jgi:glucose-1-phosphate adenylyltransferase
MRKDVVAMVLVGGRGTRLKQITKDTAKPAVSFGGKYRLIDFVLSNLSNSLIDTCGIITQYEPHELMNYISLGSTWDLDVNEGGVQFLTPYTASDGEKWQKGTAHAIKQHFSFIKQYNPKHVIILGGDHIYKMDYRKLIEHHERKKADVTISTFKVTDDPSRYGILTSDESDCVVDFEEKPNTPKSDQASMGIYVFNTGVLAELLFSSDESSFDFGHDIIPLSLKRNYRVYTYPFSGYFKDVGTVQSLYDTNMDLIDNPHFLKLHEYVDFPIYTKSSNLPPHHFGRQSVVHNSLISDGCLIYGDVYHSVLSSEIYIATDSIVKNSIIFENVRVQEQCVIENAIILKGTVLMPKTRLVFDEVTIVDNKMVWKLGENDA